MARRGRRRARTGEPRLEAPQNHSGPPLDVDGPTELMPVIDSDSGSGRGNPPERSALRASSLAIAGSAGLLTLALALGATLPYGPYAVVIFVVQVLYAVTWTIAWRPPAPRIVAGVGLAAAAAADLAAVWVDPASLTPLAYVTAAAFVAGVVGQLTRPVGRERVTESLGSTLAVVVGVVALGNLVVLSRHPRGTQSIVACLVAAGVAVMVARLTDLVAPHPRIAPQVPRGGAGVLLGLLVGAGAAAIAGSLIAGLSTGAAAAAGLATALIAVVVDLSMDYAQVGRQLAGDPPAPWPTGLVQGPLAAFALAAPVAYAASTLLLSDYS
ncbi:MAG: hypothetical protein JWP76_3225 [Dactylosporangium sp.]|nr:hypothetical protein [Dactylosporangium sp.]